MSERTLAGLERARAKGKVPGRPRIKREHDKDVNRIQQLREDGQSYQEIAGELGRSRATVHRICMTLGCTGETQSESMTL